MRMDFENERFFLISPADDAERQMSEMTFNLLHISSQRLICGARQQCWLCYQSPALKISNTC